MAWLRCGSPLKNPSSSMVDSNWIEAVNVCPMCDQRLFIRYASRPHTHTHTRRTKPPSSDHHHPNSPSQTREPDYSKPHHPTRRPKPQIGPKPWIQSGTLVRSKVFSFTFDHFLSQGSITFVLEGQEKPASGGVPRGNIYVICILSKLCVQCPKCDRIRRNLSGCPFPPGTIQVVVGIDPRHIR